MFGPYRIVHLNKSRALAVWHNWKICKTQFPIIILARHAKAIPQKSIRSGLRCYRAHCDAVIVQSIFIIYRALVQWQQGARYTREALKTRHVRGLRWNRSISWWISGACRPNISSVVIFWPNHDTLYVLRYSAVMKHYGIWRNTRRGKGRSPNHKKNKIWALGMQRRLTTTSSCYFMYAQKLWSVVPRRGHVYRMCPANGSLKRFCFQAICSSALPYFFTPFFPSLPTGGLALAPMKVIHQNTRITAKHTEREN